MRPHYLVPIIAPLVLKDLANELTRDGDRVEISEGNFVSGDSLLSDMVYGQFLGRVTRTVQSLDGL
jgi:hypothetical protein